MNTIEFAGGTSADKLAAGWPQLLALVVVTIIVRLVIIAVTFKSTASQQKIQSLQPELAKIQAKYPNSNTNQAEKQRLAEEQMKLYKKQKIPKNFHSMKKEIKNIGMDDLKKLFLV